MTIPSRVQAPPALLKAQRLAQRLDTAIKVPYIPLSIGLDAIVGLLPGVGDLTMLAAALRIVYLGKKIGVPTSLLKVMIRNAILDCLLGFVPIVGDIVDIFFKANQTNVRIMERYWVSQNKADIDANTQREVTQWLTQRDR